MKVLVVVDMQNDFITGSLGTDEAVKIVPNVVQRIAEFDGEILATMDTHHADYLNTQEGKNLPVPHCIKTTDGWNLCQSVADVLWEKRGETFRKPAFGSCDLAFHLAKGNIREQLDEIVLVGLCTDVCVISNALLIKAFLPEVKITVDASCCAGVTPESHKTALAAMKMCQINVINEV
jgi:Amidases related to nicotinamidase